MAIIASNLKKMGQPVFDQEKIEDWKEQAPAYYSQFEGVTYTGTFIVPRDQIWYDPDEQIRQLKVIMENVPGLVKSFKREIDYNDPPPSIQKIDKIYKGRAGWTRDEAFEQLGWTHYFYDVLEFTNRRCRRRFMSATNRTFKPRTGNTINDIFSTIRKMIDYKEMEPSEKNIREEVEFLYIEGDDSDREKMIGELMSVGGIPIGDIRTYHSQSGRNSTQLWAEDNNYPYGGLKNKNLKDRVGYVMHSATAMGTWLNMLTKAYDLGCVLKKKVRSEALAFIKSPRPADFDNQRLEFETGYKMTKSKLEKVIKNCVSLDKSGNIKVDIPVEWKGFLPQKINSDPMKGGNPTEDCLVDSKGNSMTKTFIQLQKKKKIAV
jgi:hypothetical protein